MPISTHIIITPVVCNVYGKLKTDFYIFSVPVTI